MIFVRFVAEDRVLVGSERFLEVLVAEMVIADVVPANGNSVIGIPVFDLAASQHAVEEREIINKASVVKRLLPWLR